jgi:hypothetical protein
MHAVNIPSVSEIAPVLPFAAVLAGRCLAPPCPARPFWLCVFLALYAGGLGYAAARPPAAPPYAGLAGWLRAHHLTAGLGGYRQANVVTLETGGAVTLRPVTPGANDRLTAYAGTASAAWYNPAAPAATFLVLAAPEAQKAPEAPEAPTSPEGLTAKGGHRLVRPARRELPVSGV